jgi:glycosyltransferase involved in cell wall biosynthesis
VTHRTGYPYGVGACTVEATDPPASLELGAADEWRVVVTWRGTPCSYLELPSPGSISSPGMIDAAIIRHADGIAAWEQLVERLRGRLGVRDRHPVAPSCSVVVCTHRRPGYIARVLDGLRRLDPPADEIIVVDNDPGKSDCRVEAERGGARYVREDRPGLDRARNAGLRAASGELVAFTDDDCIPATGWLRSLPELFGDLSVAAVTGPGFAYMLDTPAQVRFEDQGGHRRGLQRQTFDWRLLTPIAATRAGAGLNMIFRRSLLERLGEVFPPELDAGTPTESGGDMYALYKLLRAGYRIVYDPATYVLHQHRPDARSLHRTIRGYGIGLSAVLTKLVVEERELAAPTTWYWLWWLYVDALCRRLAGQADPVEVRIGRDYLLGGLLGPAAWWRSRRSFGPDGAGPSPDAASSAVVTPATPPASAATADARRVTRPGPGISVIIAGTRTAAETRCLEALSRQSKRIGALEVIVVGAAAHESSPAVAEMTVRRVDPDPALGVRNTGAREARGDLLLFLDADAVPAPDCLAKHAACHGAAGRERLVVGYSPPEPKRPGLAALWEARRRHDHFELKRAAAAMTFADVRSSNLSLWRRTFEKLGGFDSAFERVGREGWELGVRALERGLEVCYEPAAVAAEDVTPDVRQAIAAARREGRGDALLEARHPIVTPALPVFVAPPARYRRLLSWSRGRLLGGHGATRVAALGLVRLERLRARRLWLRLFEGVRAAAYERGTLDAGGRRVPGAASATVLRVELDSEEPIPPPTVAPPVLELYLGGEAVGRLVPTGGQWHGYLADQAAAVAADRLHALPLERVPAFKGTPQGRDLSDSAVVFGPARRPGDDGHRAELEEAGAAIELMDGEPQQHWAALDSAVRALPGEIVALPLPGVAPTTAWLAGARQALEGDRVALVVGAGLPSGSPPRALFLGTRRLMPTPYPILGRPAQYLAVRRELYADVGGFHVAAARLGPQAVVLDLMDRVLDAGLVVAYREVPGLEPTAPSRDGGRRALWGRHHARGGLMLRRARQTGGLRGALWFARHGLLPLWLNVWRRSGDRSVLRASGAAAAFLSGCLRAAADRPGRGRSAAGPVSSAPKPPKRRVR